MLQIQQYIKSASLDEAYELLQKIVTIKSWVV